MAVWKKVIVSGSNAHLNQVTASFFSGDGSGINNVISSSYALTASYALNGGGAPSVTASYALTASYLDNVAKYFATFEKPIADVTWSFQHNLSNRFPVITVWDSNYEVVIPEKIYSPSVNQTVIYFPTSQSGYAAAAIGSILPTGSNGIFSGSFFGDGSGLTGIISSVPNGTVSGSEQLTQSYDQRYHRLGTNLFSSSQQVQYSQISNVPSGILSSSIGFVLSTETSSFLRNEFSSSTETRFNRLEQQTSSYAQNSALTPLFNFTASTLTRLGIIEQATSSYVLNASTQSFAIKTEISGAFTQLSSSFQSRISTFENKTLISGSEQLTGSYDLRYHRLGTGLLSSSGQIANDISGSFISSSNSLSGRIGIFEGKTLFSGSSQVIFQQISNVPIGLISSSQQINTGSFTGSFKGDGSQLTGILSSSYALSASYVPNVTLPSNIFSSSQQVQFSGITGIPNNLVSGSDQLSSSYDLKYELKGRNVVSSSQQLINLLPNNLVSGSDQLTGSYDLRYERTGNNIVSSSQQIKNLLPAGSISSSLQLNSIFESKGTGILSSSLQIANDISGSFNQISSSFQSRVSVFENKTLFSSSQQLPNNLVSGSEQLTSSYDARYHRLGTGLISSSNQISTDISGSTTALSASISSRVFSLEQTTGSLNSITGSILNRLTSLQSVTSSYATTGSNTFIGNQIISGSLNVTGSINVIGQVSGTFIGNGSGLTGIIATVNPAGPNKSLQFNDAGATSGSLNFTFDKTNNSLYLTGSLIATSITSSLQGSASYALTASYAIRGGSQVVGINSQVGTAYTLSLADAGQYLRMNNANPITLTIPTNATVPFETGSVVSAIQVGAGIITVSGSGVTMNAFDGRKTAGQYAVIQMIKVDTNIWDIIGGVA